MLTAHFLLYVKLQTLEYEKIQKVINFFIP